MAPHDDVPLTLALARACLLVTVTPDMDRGLADGCLYAVKAMFMPSKSSAHDNLFRSSSALADLLAIFSAQSGGAYLWWQFPFQAMVYGVATLKNASADEANQAHLYQQGAVRTLAAMMRCVLQSQRRSRRRSRRHSRSRRRRSSSSIGKEGEGDGEDEEDDEVVDDEAESEDGDVYDDDDDEDDEDEDEEEENSSRRRAKRLRLKASRAAQLLVQLTGALRNLCMSNKHYKQFQAAAVCSTLGQLLPRFTAHGELMLNIARVLSKLSMSDSARADMRGDDFLAALLRVLQAHPTHNALLVRICFVLGNLTGGSSDIRALLGLELGGAAVLLSLLRTHTKEYLRLQDCVCSAEAKRAEGGEDAVVIVPEEDDDDDAAASGEGSKAAEEDSKLSEGKAGRKKRGVTTAGDAAAQLRRTEEVLVKLIRAIANLCIDDSVGATVAQSADVAALLDVLQRAASGSNEELLLNAVSALTNVTFYLRDDGSSVLSEEAGNMTQLLVPALLYTSNAELVQEAARALGNLTRLPAARVALFRCRVHEMLLLLLDHSVRDVVFTVCGVLINVVGDAEHASLLAEDGLAAVPRLVDVLRAASLADLPMASRALMVLTNAALRFPFEEEDISSLRATLDELVSALVDEDEDGKEVVYDDASGERSQFVALSEDLLAALRAQEAALHRRTATDTSARATSHGDSDLEPLDDDRRRHK
eukprot:PLAT1177.2.p1 GENE.PLAT1177.2~~PLAT1177.2.p1  ORF type:complete len:783 (-),score=426.14 PLAT1177.2:741-2855(-)